MLELTKRQARRFLLLRHGLLGKKQYKGKEGVLAFLQRLRILQYDPVNICGRSPELSLLARVDGYRPEYLWELLYKDRLLVDHYDKCMCILPIEDFKALRRIRENDSIYGRRREQIEPAIPHVLELARQLPHISTKEIGIKDKIEWPWGATSVGRAAAERLYFEGRLIVHHKEGVVRHYTLAEKVGLEQEIHAPDPHPAEEKFYKWIVRRRLYAIGMMENRPGDGFLGIPGWSAATRKGAFAALEAEGAIFPVLVEGKVWYIDSRDREILEAACDPALKVPARCALIAPLDSLIWDRRTIQTLFDFDYKWEIYTPEPQRKYGAYVLPVVYRDAIVGRIEPVADRKRGVLEVRNFWPEDGFRPTKVFSQALERELKLLARFNGVIFESLDAGATFRGLQDKCKTN